MNQTTLSRNVFTPSRHVITESVECKCKKGIRATQEYMGNYRITCLTCKATGQYGSTEDEMIKLWNAMQLIS